MKYLMRAARRLSTAGAPQVRPAMPSRSPLAEADQRLNIDSFSAHFDLPVVPERAQAAPEEDEPALRSGSARARRRHPAAEMPPSPAVGPALAPSKPVVPSVQPKPQSENAPARGKSGGKALAKTRPPSQRRAVRLPQPAAARGSEPPSFSDKATVLPDRRGPEVPARRVTGLPDAATAEDRSLAAEPLRREPANRVKGAAEREPGADTAMDALSRAMSWVDGQGRRSREAERGERRKESSSPGSQPRLGERVEARPLRAILRDTRPITHLEIGKIEVEVVPSAKPAQNAAPTRPSPKTTGFSGPSRPVFGWRQR